MGTFGNWPESIHDESDQIKRIASAKKKETTPSSVDKASFTGFFAGSGKEPYRTSLQECTCGDYTRRHKPCKHIYRLAMECGLFDGDFQTGVNKNVIEASRINLNQAVAEIEKLSDDDQNIVKFMLNDSLYGGEEYRIMSSKDHASLLECGLLVCSPVPSEDYFQSLKKTELVEIVQNMEDAPVKAKKADIAAWLIEKGVKVADINPDLVSVSFLPELEKTRRSLYFYLHRKYDMDSFYDEYMRRREHPAGSKQKDFAITIGTGVVQSTEIDLKFYFPDDEITRLLTQYGHNRCLEGYELQDAEEV